MYVLMQFYGLEDQKKLFLVKLKKNLVMVLEWTNMRILHTVYPLSVTPRGISTDPLPPPPPLVHVVIVTEPPERN